MGQPESESGPTRPAPGGGPAGGGEAEGLSRARTAVDQPDAPTAPPGSPASAPFLGARSAPARPRPAALSPLGFVLGFGVVSLLGDATYEGARAVLGPYLAKLGAGAALVGLVTGAGEAVASVLRLATGPAADRRSRRWGLAGGGYVLNVAVVPLLALASALWSAIPIVLAERAGKAVKAPARDSMLADAGSQLGQGRVFAIHEAMDQTGALVGPLLVALVLAVGAGYRSAFALLAIPAAGVVAVLAWLRRQVPDPSVYAGPGRGGGEPEGAARAKAVDPSGRRGGSRRAAMRALPPAYLVYLVFAVLTMVGYATFGVLAYHLAVHRVVSPATVPLVFAAAMAAAAVVALAGGALYGRVGLRGLVVLPVLAAAVPFLSFSTRPVLAWLGAVAWGAAMGLHESTMRAAVADLVGAARRGLGYGVFGAAYGLAAMGGGAAIGVLYAVSVGAAKLYVVAVEAVAMVAVVPLVVSPRGVRSTPP